MGDAEREREREGGRGVNQTWTRVCETLRLLLYE